MIFKQIDLIELNLCWFDWFFVFGLVWPLFRQSLGQNPEDSKFRRKYTRWLRIQTSSACGKSQPFVLHVASIPRQEWRHCRRILYIRIARSKSFTTYYTRKYLRFAGMKPSSSLDDIELVLGYNASERGICDRHRINGGSFIHFKVVTLWYGLY